MKKKQIKDKKSSYFYDIEAVDFLDHINFKNENDYLATGEKYSDSEYFSNTLNCVKMNDTNK